MASMSTSRITKSFTKDDTLALKGLAIQVMVFLHLFLNKEASYEGLYNPFGGGYFEYLLSRCAGMCVSLYIMLSGYGLYLSWMKSGKINGPKRIAKLYVNFWIVALVFIPLGLLLNPDKYQLTVSTLVNNLTGWHTTWNGEWWFLFPYVLLIAVAPWFFKVVRKVNQWILFIALLILYGTMFTPMKLFPEQLREYRALWMLVRTTAMLFSFGVGAIFAKHNVFALCRDKIQSYRHANVWIVLVLTASVIIRSLIPNSIVDPIFGVWFLTAFACIKRPQWLNRLLYPLGHQSTNMWLCHTFFCYYLFSEYVYALHYSPLIFVGLLFVSYLTALAIDHINQPLQKFIFK